MIKPKRLKPGDTIGLITPASFITNQQLEKSVANLNELGFEVVYKQSVLSKKGYLAGSDEERVAELHEMFAGKNIDGIICARGGYGVPRILSMIDYDLIRNNPKVFVGYSDITALLQAIYVKTGLVCFHGPMGISNFNSFATGNFKKVLMEPEENHVAIHPEKEIEKEDAEEFIPYVINDGTAEGQLIGGNLALLAALIGTPFDIDYTGKIIFIEDIGEEPYRIDRMLTQLLLSGQLAKASGIALGVFKNCRTDEPEGNSLSLREVFEDRLKHLNIPTVYGLRFGHITDNATFPVGIKARLDATKQSLTIIEKAVSN